MILWTQWIYKIPKWESWHNCRPISGGVYWLKYVMSEMKRSLHCIQRSFLRPFVRHQGGFAICRFLAIAPLLISGHSLPINQRNFLHINSHLIHSYLSSLFFAQSLTFLKDCKWRQQTAIFSFDASSPNIFGITVENMVYYRDSNPFMVHMLLLWFSGWYSFYSYNTVKRESINGSTTCTVALPHVTGL
jgi:hypothetical protein